MFVGAFQQTAVLVLCVLSPSAFACKLGLTQLRLRSLELIRCVPAKEGEQDPCPALVNGREAYCELEKPDNQFVCCGSVELLIDLLSVKETRVQPSPQLGFLKRFERPMGTAIPVLYDASRSIADAPTSQSTTTSPTHFDVSPTNGFYIYPQPMEQKALYPRVEPNFTTSSTSGPAPVPLPLLSPNLLPPAPLIPPAIATIPPLPTTSPAYPLTKNYTLILMPPTYPPFNFANIMAKNYSEMRSAAPIPVEPIVDTLTTRTPLRVILTNGSRVISNMNMVEMVEEDGPLLTLITNAHFSPGNISNTWLAASSVVLLQDGPCSIVVNTGLPVQRNEIAASLAAKGIIGNKLDYTVITSGFPQFIGNVNLFPASQFVVGMLYAHWTTIAVSNLLDKQFIDLCSSKTQIIHTPGPTPDAISVIARKVPAMGTVAVTGALFMQDDNLNRVDSAFVWNEQQLFASRRRVVCLSDWIIPAHSVPIPVSRNLKRLAGCI